MSETNSNDIDVKKYIDFNNDEIELIDLFRVIWKWKYLITLGTLTCALVTAVVCFFYPKIYRVEMILQPGLYREDGIGKSYKNGNRTSYIDSASKIQFHIESGIFDNEVLDSLKKQNENNIPATFNFKLFYSRPAETLTVAYETPVTKQGLEILKLLKTAIEKHYDPVVNAINSKYDARIARKQSEILKLQESNGLSKGIVKSIEGRIEELEAEIDNLNIGLGKLENDLQKEELQDKSDNANTDNLPYKSVSLINLGSSLTGFKNDLSNYRIQIKQERLLLRKREIQINDLLSDISILKVDRHMVENVRVLKPPTINPEPVRPQPLIYITIALAFGLFTTLFLTFLLDYIIKYNQMKS